MPVQTSMVHLIVFALVWFVCGVTVGLRIGEKNDK